MSATEVFHYLILSVYEWVRSKVPEEDQQAPELQVPAPAVYGSVEDGAFAPFHLNIGFALDITPLMGEGVWALRIKQTDSGSDNHREPVGWFVEPAFFRAWKRLRRTVAPEPDPVISPAGRVEYINKGPEPAYSSSQTMFTSASMVIFSGLSMSEQGVAAPVAA